MKLLHPKYILLLCIAICLFVTSNIHWGKNKWQNIIEADAKGYYAYLPATFIYHDLNFGFYDSIEKKKYYNPVLVYDYRSTAPNGSRIDKYYCGTALAQLPFFLAAHCIAFISGNETDGFSRIYLLSITLAAIFYLFIGLRFANKLLELYEIRPGFRSFTLVALLFGTNLFFYSVCEMGMSHIYSFAFVSMFCYYAKRFFVTNTPKYIPVLFALLGMIFLIRPVNILILLALPFLAGSVSNLMYSINKTIQNVKSLVLGGLLLFGFIFIQALIYKISTGDWWVYSYGEERFNFSDPHFIDILFSYKKGLFLYTPLYLIALAGSWFLYKRNKFEAVAFLFFFIVSTFILSCWWNWWYGGSFSGRVFVEYLSLFMLLFAFLMQHIVHRFARIFSNVLIVLLIALCQFQTYQYRYYVIHWENMTKEKYWNVFLSMKKD